MLIKFGILIGLILGTIIFLGIKMSENIKQKEIKLLFFCLYGMTIFTVFNICVSLYFYVALKNKRGPVGPRGKKGEIGDTGIDGVCNLESCLRKSLQNIIINTMEKNGKDVNSKVRTGICSLSEQIPLDNLQKIVKQEDLIENIKEQAETIENDNDNIIQVLNEIAELFDLGDSITINTEFCSNK
jgi:hypothetical protein